MNENKYLTKEQLERRIGQAIEQLQSLANERSHRRNGAPFAEIDEYNLFEVVFEVIDILQGGWDE